MAKKRVGKQQRKKQGEASKETTKEINGKGRPPKYETPEEMQQKIDEYFEKGVRTREILIGQGAAKKKVNMPVPTISGLVYHLGFSSRTSFYDYQTNKDFAYIVKRAALFIEMQYEELLQQGNVTGAIFALKNMGWRDQPKDDTPNANITVNIE